jgi:hypothetical protein
MLTPKTSQPRDVRVMTPPKGRLTSRELLDIEARESRVHLPDRRRLLDELAATRAELEASKARLQKVLELLWDLP